MTKGEEKTRSLSVVRCLRENKEMIKKLMILTGEGYVRRRKRRRRIKTEERVAWSYRESRQHRGGHARERVLGRRERQRDFKQRDEAENSQRDDYREDFVGGEREEGGRPFFLSSSTSCLSSSPSCKGMCSLSSFPFSSGLPSLLIASGLCASFSSAVLPSVFSSSSAVSSLRDSPLFSPSHCTMASLSRVSSSSTSCRPLHASGYLSSSSCSSQLTPQCLSSSLGGLSSHSSSPPPGKNFSHSTQSRLLSCSSSSSFSSPLLSSSPPLSSSSSSPPSSFSSSPCASVSDTVSPDTFNKEGGSLCQSIALTRDSQQEGEEAAREHFRQGDLRDRTLSSSCALRERDSFEQSSCVDASAGASEGREASADTPASKESRVLGSSPGSTPPAPTAAVIEPGSPVVEKVIQGETKKKRKKKKKESPVVMQREGRGREEEGGRERSQTDQKRRESDVNTSCSAEVVSSSRPQRSLSVREEERREREEGIEVSEDWIKSPSFVLKRLAKAPWAARLLRELKEIEEKGMARRRRRKKVNEPERRDRQENKRGEQTEELDKSQDKTGRGMLSLDDDNKDGAKVDVGDDWEMRFWWFENAPRLFLSTLRQHATSEPSVQLRMLELLLVRTPLLSVVRSEQAGRTGGGERGEEGRREVSCEEKRRERDNGDAEPASSCSEEDKCISLKRECKNDTSSQPPAAYSTSRDFPSHSAGKSEIQPSYRGAVEHSRRGGGGGEESACGGEQDVDEKTSSGAAQDFRDGTEPKRIHPQGNIQQKTDSQVEEKTEERLKDTAGDRSSLSLGLLLPSSSSSLSPSLALDFPFSGASDETPERKKKDCECSRENVEITEEDVQAFGTGFVLFSQDPRFPVEHRLWCVDQFVFFLGHSCRSASLQQVEDKYHEKEEGGEGKPNRRTRGGKGSSSSLDGRHHEAQEREAGPCHSSSSPLSSSRTDQREGGDEIRAGHRISSSGFLVVSDIRVWRVLAASVKWLAEHGYFEFAARITYTLLTFIYDIRAFPAPPHSCSSSSSPLSLLPSTGFSRCSSSARQQETASEGLLEGAGNPSRALSRPSIADGGGEPSQLRHDTEEGEEESKQALSSDQQTTCLAGETGRGSRCDSISLLDGSESKMSKRKREEELIRKRNDRWKVPKHLWLQALGMRHKNSRHTGGASSLSASSSVSSRTPFSSCSSLPSAVDRSSSSCSSDGTSGAIVTSDHPTDSHSLSRLLSRHSQMSMIPSLEPHEVAAVDLVDNLFLTLKNEATKATALLARAILFFPSSCTTTASSSLLTQAEMEDRRGAPEGSLERRGGKRGREGKESQVEEEGEGEKKVRAEMTARLASKFAPSDDRGRGVGTSTHYGEDQGLRRSSGNLTKKLVVVKKIGSRSALSFPTDDIVHHETQDIHTDGGLMEGSVAHHVQHACREIDVCAKDWEVLELSDEESEGRDGFLSSLQNSSLMAGYHHLPHQLREQQATTGRGNLIRREGAYSPAFGFTCLAWYLRLESIFYRVQDMSLTSLACRLLTHFIRHGEPQRLFPCSPPSSSSSPIDLPTSWSASSSTSTAPPLSQSPPSVSVSSSSSPPASMASSSSSRSSGESTSPPSSSCRSPLLSVRTPLSLLSPLSRAGASPSSSFNSASFSSSSSLLISPVGATALANIVGSLKAVRLYEHDLLSQICTVLKSHLSLLPAHIICELMYNVGCLGFTDPSFADAVSSYLVHSNVLRDVKTDWIMQVLIGFTRLDLRDENLIAACIEGLLSSPSIDPSRNDAAASSLKRFSRPPPSPTSLSSSASPSFGKGDEDVLQRDIQATSFSTDSAEVAGSSAGLEEQRGSDGSPSQALPSQHCSDKNGGQSEGNTGNKQYGEDAPRRKMVKRGSSHQNSYISPGSSSLQGAANILARTQRPASLFYLLHGISFNNVRSLRLLSSLLPALHKYASTVPVNVVVLGFHDIIRMSIWPGPLRGAIVPNLMRNLHRLSLATLASSSMLCWSFWGHFDVPLLLCLVKQFRLKLSEESSLSLSSSSSSVGEGRSAPVAEGGEDKSSYLQHPSEVQDEGMKEMIACSSTSSRETSGEAISQRKTPTEKRSLSVERLKNSGGGTAKTITLIKASTQLWSSLYGIEVLSLTPRDFISTVAVSKDSRTYLQEKKDVLARGEAHENTCEEASWGREGDRVTSDSPSLSRGGSVTPASSSSLADSQTTGERSASPSSCECRQGASSLSASSSFSAPPPSFCRDDTKHSLSFSQSADLIKSVSSTSGTSTGATAMNTNTRSLLSSTHPTTRLYVSAFLSSRSSTVLSTSASPPPGILFSPWRTGSLQGLKLARLLEIPESQWTPKSSSFHEEVLAALSTCVRGKLINEQAVGPYGIDIVVPPKAMAGWRERKHVGEKMTGGDSGEENKKKKKMRSEQKKKCREKDEKKTKEPKKRVKVSHA